MGNLALVNYNIIWMWETFSIFIIKDGIVDWQVENTPLNYNF